MRMAYRLWELKAAAKASAPKVGKPSRQAQAEPTLF